MSATIVVEFNGGADDGDYVSLIQLDDISNNDETSFGPGSEPVFQVHFSGNVRIDEIVPTDGNVVSMGSVSRTQTEETAFTSRDSEEPTVYRLPVAPDSTSISYLGRTGSLSSELLPGGIVEYTGTISHTPFRAKLDMTYTAQLYRLIPPTLSLGPDETYNITIVFYVTLV